MTQEHSPLPWKIKTDLSGIIFDAEQAFVGKINGATPTDAQLIITAANAYPKLIEDVATLKEALEAISHYIPKSSATEGGASAHSGNVRAADMVRNALKKVKTP